MFRFYPCSNACSPWFSSENRFAFFSSFITKIFLSLFFIFTGEAFSQTTYTWTGVSGASWAVSTNWSPARAAPAANDVILFNSGTTLNVTAVPTETIRSLTVTSSSNITLTGAVGALTLSINGPTLINNLVIDVSSTLQLTSAGTTLTLNFLTTASQRGQIDGTLQLNTKGLFNTSSIGTTLVTVGSGGTIVNNYQTGGGIPVVSSTATLSFASGSNYNHITTIQVSVPTATYNVNSTANFNAGTSTINNMTQTFGNVTVNSAGTLTLNVGSPTIAGVFTLTAGVFAVGANALTLNGTMASTGTGNITASGAITIGGSGGDYGTLRFTAAPTLTSFTMNRASAGTVGITQALTIGAAGTLNLTNGVINSGGNLISVTNGAAASVTNTGGTASYVNGALQRTMAANLSAATILFPIGKTACQKVTFNGLSTTSSASTVVIRAEAFDANSGGTFDPSLTAINTDNYWSATIISNPTSLANPGTISLTDASPVPDATTAVATSSTLAGQYFSLGGNTAAPTVTSTLAVPVTLGYFVLGTKNATALCGTYSVGPTGNFLTITEAVNSLNIRPVSCNVIFELETTYAGAGERYPINILYAGISSATATFRPVTGAGTLTTSGDPGSGFPLINFNGADYVTFDGRAGGAGTTVSWIIRNTRTASVVGPAIQFSNGATYDVLQYVRTESQNSTSTSGTIYISSYPIWSAGNNNLTIQNCDVTKYTSGATTHINAIYAYGQTANPNNYISILNNNIHSFTPGLTAEACGVTVTGTGLNTDYGDNWTITGNSFYLDCAEQQLYRYTVINFIPGLGSGGNTISNNYIGGGAPLCAGATWTSAVGGAGNTIQTFEGIYVWAGATTISGNTIQNISLTATGGTSFGAIHLADCSASASYSITNNLIGSAATCNSIQNAGQWKTVGIWVDNSCGTISLTNNTLANITATNAVNTAATVTGMYSDCGSNTITGNTIYNLTATTATSVSQLYIAHDGNVVGIANNSIYSGTTQNISNNTIYNLKSNYTGASANKFYGIYTAIGEPGQLHTYNANLIYGFDAANGSSNARIIGIGAVGSSWTSAVTSIFSNNMIALGYRVDGSSITSGAEITGILDNTSGYTSGVNTTYMNYYYNSVYIGGTGVTGTTNNTYAFRRNNTNISPKNTEDIRDNIFVNCRSNSTGTKIHYSFFLDNTSTVASNYNDGWGNGTGYKFGNATAVDYVALANWQPGVSQDAQSISADPLFYSTTSGVPDLHIQSGSPAIDAGTAVSTTTDFDGVTRSGAADIGADDYSGSYTYVTMGVTGCGPAVSLPIELLRFNGYLKDEKAYLYWSTASEINNDYFTIERSLDAITFDEIGTVKGAGNFSTIRNYTFIDSQLETLNLQSETTFYYRLKQTDFDGKFEYSNSIALNNSDSNENNIVVFPNPNNGEFTVYGLQFPVQIRIYNSLGQIIHEQSVNKNSSAGISSGETVNLSEANGIYLLKIITEGKNISYLKIIKQ
ncbi:MAG: T9SS type A sorting domain-containing protein [Bacteroidetes bacterium]|nr:T9SS type A sorting domain-containing protein [Bacteroidota bacterium]